MPTARAALLAIALLLGTTVPVIAGEAEFQACRKKLIQAQKLEVLNWMDWKAPREPEVVGGPTYYSMPFDAKTGFAETVNCFLMAGKTGCLSFDITHWQTGRATERFHMCRLRPK